MNDLYFMDYDTYHQVVGGSFLDYTEWLNSIKPIQLEEPCKPLLSEPLKIKEDKKSTTDDTSNQIFLFLLELLGSHYGLVFNDSSSQRMTTEEKINECLQFYQTLGMNQECTVNMVKQYLKDLGRR